MTSTISLFTDGSVHTATTVGYGAYLLVKNIETPLGELKGFIQIKRFENTSSTRLELQTLLWALGKTPTTDHQINIYTDSQNIIGLPGRREKLELNGFRSKNNRLLNNHDLYQQFYQITDTLNCNFIKVIGHQPTSRKNTIESIFTLVDKATRTAVRTI